MYRVRRLLGGWLSLRKYNTQVGEAYAMIKALNKLTRLGLPKTCRVDLKACEMGVFCFFWGELRNKAY